MQAAFLRITTVQPHVVQGSVLYLSAWKVKNAERWKIAKEKKCQVIQKGGEEGGLNLPAADIFMHTRD